LCKSLAVEWKDFARVNTVSPGFVNTGLSGAPEAAPVLEHAYKYTPLSRIADPRELKGVRFYLSLTQGSAYVHERVDLLVPR
jgi:sorbose reductase